MTCEKCLHFEMDDDAHYRWIGGKYIYCYLHRCRFDPKKVNGMAPACGKFEDRYAHEIAENRKRYGFDKPVEPVDGAEQGELL